MEPTVSTVTASHCSGVQVHTRTLKVCQWHSVACKWALLEGMNYNSCLSFVNDLFLCKLSIDWVKKKNLEFRWAMGGGVRTTFKMSGARCVKRRLHTFTRPHLSTSVCLLTSIFRTLQLQTAKVRLQDTTDHLSGYRLLQRGLVHPSEDGPQRSGDVPWHPFEGGGAGGWLQWQRYGMATGWVEGGRGGADGQEGCQRDTSSNGNHREWLTNVFAVKQSASGR